MLKLRMSSFMLVGFNKNWKHVFIAKGQISCIVLGAKKKKKKKTLTLAFLAPRVSVRIQCLAVSGT